MASWEERLDQLEQNFLAEVERLKEDILGQLNVNLDKYYTIDNEVTTSFTSLAAPSACWATPSLTKIEKSDEHAATTAVVETPNGPTDGECSASNNNVESPSVAPSDPPAEEVIVPPTVVEPAPQPATPPADEPPAVAAAVSSTLSPPVARSRRATPARQAEAHVVRVRVTYKFESQEEDELPLAKGLELIAFMREDESWWWGQRPDGKVGIFPSNFVTVLAGDPDALPIREDDIDEGDEQQEEEEQEEGDHAVHPPLQQSSPSEHATAAQSASSVAVEAETPPSSGQRRPPPPPSARLKPTTLLSSTVAASADGTQGAASAKAVSNPATSTTTPAPTSTTPAKKPAVPQPSLKPTQRGEAAKKDWHEKRRSILLLQEQSRTTRLLAQWEKAGAGLSFAPPPAQ